MNIITRMLNYQKAKLYFENVNINKLVQKSEWVQSLCINEDIGKGYYNHHLPLKQKEYPVWHNPDDWNLPKDTVEQVLKISKELEFHYIYAFFLVTKGDCYISPENLIEMDFSSIKDKLFPLWIAFPIYDQKSMAWRQWLEHYSFLFNIFLKSLSEKERFAYYKRFPFPSYWYHEQQEESKL